MRDSQNVYLSIIQGIISGQNLEEIAESLGKSKQALNRYVQNLKKQGYIKKVGYGVWDIDKKYSEEKFIQGRKEEKTKEDGNIKRRSKGI